MSDDDILIIIGGQSATEDWARRTAAELRQRYEQLKSEGAYLVCYIEEGDRMDIREISAEELYIDRAEQLASITLARKELGPDPTESWPALEKRPRQTWDNDPVRNRRARQRQGRR